jgi:signal transduction histidine kinase
MDSLATEVFFPRRRDGQKVAPKRRCKWGILHSMPKAAQSVSPESGASTLDLIIHPPMSRTKVSRISIAGFGLVVGLVLLAAYLGYSGSQQIQGTAQTLIREHLVNTERGATLEALIVGESRELLSQLALVLGFCFLLAAGTAILTIRIIQQAFAKLEWQSAELARISWHLLDSQEKMARRFSHEMHDELGQSLSELRRMLGRVKDSDFGSIRGECIEVVDEVIENVRKLSQVLRPVILDDFGLDHGLRWLCDRFTERTQIPVHYTSNLNERLAEALETHLFRIAQEALTNIARHSGASEAWVKLAVDHRTVRLSIADNGRGLKLSAERASPSLGMVGMRARARQIHGELLVENRKEGGLAIRVEVPLKRVESDAEQENPSFVG